MMSDKAAILKSDRPGWVKVVTPYNKSFVQDLKDEIPPGHRMWDAALKCWYVNDVYLDELITCVKHFYKNVETDLLQSEAPAGTGPYAELHLLSSAPNELIKKAYQLLAFKAHPDSGGSDAAFKKLNGAYEVICKERGI